MAAASPTLISCAEARRLGHKRYFTGCPCPQGHVAERYISSRLCVLCCAQRKMQWARSNLDKVTAYNLAHYAKNSARACKRSKSWRQDNPDKAKILKAAHYRRHRDRYRAKFKSYNERNTDKSRESHRRKAAENPERYAAYKRNRKARKRNAEGVHSAADIGSIRKAQNGRCACCRRLLSGVLHHVDHIMPLARGGTNWPRNLQILCAPCNQSKSARDPIEFMRAKGRLL